MAYLGAVDAGLAQRRSVEGDAVGVVNQPVEGGAVPIALFDDCQQVAALRGGQPVRTLVVEDQNTRGRRRCPSYEEFLEALADPEHEQHHDTVRWSGRPFDSEDAGTDRIVERFESDRKEMEPAERQAQSPQGNALSTVCGGLRRMVMECPAPCRVQTVPRRRRDRSAAVGGRVRVPSRQAPLRRRRLGSCEVQSPQDPP